MSPDDRCLSQIRRRDGLRWERAELFRDALRAGVVRLDQRDKPVDLPTLLGRGTSLYPQLAQRVNDPEALRVVPSIGPTEATHFQTWHDKAGNAPPLTDPPTGSSSPT